MIGVETKPASGCAVENGRVVERDGRGGSDDVGRDGVIDGSGCGLEREMIDGSGEGVEREMIDGSGECVERGILDGLPRLGSGSVVGATMFKDKGERTGTGACVSAADPAIPIFKGNP